MKKIEITYRQEVVTSKIIRVPNSFEYDEFDEDILKFNQIWEYFNKTRAPFKLKSNQYLGDFNLISVEELD